MAYVFEGRVHKLGITATSNNTLQCDAIFEVCTFVSMHDKKIYCAYEEKLKNSDSKTDRKANINAFNESIATCTIKDNKIFDFISVHCRDLLEIEYEKDGNTRTITKVTLLND